VQTRFFITVKKNYRSVAYHNWSHGFHVANSIYSILKASPGIFRPLEVIKSQYSGLYLWTSNQLSDSIISLFYTC
jgi:cAMP and cAMP-inhibited cGMP 3',5'-cyclic phosphodiesterase 10